MGILLFLVFSYKFLVSVPRFLSVKFEGCKKRLIMDCPILTWNCLEIYWARKNGVDALMDQRVNLSVAVNQSPPVQQIARFSQLVKQCFCITDIFSDLQKFFYVCLFFFSSVGGWGERGRIGENITRWCPAAAAAARSNLPQIVTMPPHSWQSHNKWLNPEY